MSSEQANDSVSLKSRIEHVTSIIIPSLFIITNLLTFDASTSFYCDYIVFIYTTCLLLFVVVKLIGLKFVSALLKDKFALIDGIKGKGIIVVSVSLLYISNGGWRTCMSIMLLANGMYLLLIEWLWPSKDNLLHTPSEYNKDAHTKGANVDKSSSKGNSNSNSNNSASDVNTVELDKTEDNKSKSNPYEVGEDF